MYNVNLKKQIINSFISILVKVNTSLKGWSRKLGCDSRRDQRHHPRLILGAVILMVIVTFNLI